MGRCMKKVESHCLRKAGFCLVLLKIQTGKFTPVILSQALMIRSRPPVATAPQKRQTQTCPDFIHESSIFGRFKLISKSIVLRTFAVVTRRPVELESHWNSRIMQKVVWFKFEKSGTFSTFRMTALSHEVVLMTSQPEITF